MGCTIDGLVPEAVVFDAADLKGLSRQVDDVASEVPGRQGRAAWLLDVLALAAPRKEAKHVVVEADDGEFRACLPLALLDRALLCYALKGQDLPRELGGPLRLLIPDAAVCHHAAVDACANVKFVSRLTLVAEAIQDTRPSSEADHRALHEREDDQFPKES